MLKKKTSKTNAKLLRKLSAIHDATKQLDSLNIEIRRIVVNEPNISFILIEEPQEPELFANPYMIGDEAEGRFIMTYFAGIDVAWKVDPNSDIYWEEII